MKKSLIFASIACAGAFALHADNWTYQDWFTGIGTGATATNDMKATNGSWNFSGVTSGTVDYSGGLVFDLEEGESVAFNVTSATAPDTNTKTAVEVKGIFTPVSTNDLPNQSTMNDRGAQIGFVVGTTTTPSTNYYAWVGGADWIPLTSPVDPSANGPSTETDLLVTFDYTVASAAKASFAILTSSGGAVTTNTLTSNSEEWITLTSNATSNRCVAGVSCYGSGKLVAANGDVGLGVASIGTGASEVKYGSLADAITGAGTSASTITVLRETNEDVNIPATSDITINDPANNVKGDVTVLPGATVKVAASPAELNTVAGQSATNGVYEIPLTVKGDGTYVVTLPDAVSAYKEIAETNIVENSTKIAVTLQTKGEFVRAITPTGAGKALAASESKLRDFLNKNANAAYSAKDATASTMATALEASVNGRPLWQSYELGVEPTDSIKPVSSPVRDTDGSYITLAIPAIDTTKQGGDFAVKYKVGEDVYTEASAIKIPLPEAGTAATYDVKVTLE